ncbi:Transposase-associated domain [Sesbania bispinosa]|nr:Transposase-associated domain [Sesbania bispinosa]
MEVPENRKWMDNRVDCDKNITEEFLIGIHEFVKFACEQDENGLGRGKIRCPCKKCKCRKYEDSDTVKVHLCMKGFMNNYYHWTNHGEPIPQSPPMVVDHSYYGSNGQREMFDNYEQLVMDAVGPQIGNYLEQEGRNHEETMTEDPNPEAQRFFEMLNATQSPLWDGCDNYSMLSDSLTALSLKTDYGLSEGIFNGWVKFMGDTMSPGRPSGKGIISTLDDKDMKVVHLYILLNCPEVVPYLKNVTIWPSYVINGYKFVTKSQNEGMGTMNYGVCVQGGQYDTMENDYYGVLSVIVELEYTASPTKKLVLFKCEWFDPSPQGTRIDNYGNVEIRKSRIYQSYDPFILAQQAEQVYFTSFPDGQQGWLGVIKTKARSIIQSLENNRPETNDAYQDDYVQQMPLIVANDDLQQSFVDSAGVVEEVSVSLLNQYDLDEEEEEEDIELLSDSEEDEDELLDQDIEEEERLEQGEDDEFDEAYEETDSN